MSALQITAITLITVASLVGVALFARTVGYLVRVIRLGAPDPTRGGHAGDRARSVLVETLGHARLGKWPLIGIMHWFVFVGFGALFFTLLTAYGQVFDPTFALPVIGSWAPYEWLSEVIAWLTGLGILTLIVVRQVQHPRRAGVNADTRVTTIPTTTDTTIVRVSSTVPLFGRSMPAPPNELSSPSVVMPTRS